MKRAAFAKGTKLAHRGGILGRRGALTVEGRVTEDTYRIRWQHTGQPDVVTVAYLRRHFTRI